jgi:ATP-dependent DNA ligase
MLPFASPLMPMLAEAQDEIPRGEGWVYEPKWDGFRAIVFRDGDAVHLCSRNGQPLERYFPEVLTALKAVLPERCIVDGELILPGAKGLDFDALQARIHPAPSRVKRLSEETPAGFTGFDLLAVGDEDLRERPFSERRARLLQVLRATQTTFPTPQTSSADEATTWFHDFEGAGCDGIIARRVELPYAPGKRVMVKVKHYRTADVVIGGFRVGKTPDAIGALLLGVYDDAGGFHQVGHTSSFKAKEKRDLFAKLSPMTLAQGFTGPAPEQKSRWSKAAKGQEQAPWTPIEPSLVIEGRYDYLQGQRFRHASTFLRWRTDKAPKDCLQSQLEPPNAFSLARIVALATGA